MKKPEDTVYNTLKHVININNQDIRPTNDLAAVYLGFCKHLIAYMEAYETLFNSKNHYACLAIDRIITDLYIKSRLLKEAPNPFDLAEKILNNENIKKYPFPGIKDLTDTNLCKYFDKNDNNYSFYPGTNEKVSEIGLWEFRYKTGCKYIHPGKQSTLSYFESNKPNIDLMQDHKAQFFILAIDVYTNLSSLIPLINTRNNI